MTTPQLVSGRLAGFTEAQLSWLEQNFAAPRHTHTADDVIVDDDDGETLDLFVERVSEALGELVDDDQPTG